MLFVALQSDMDGSDETEDVDNTSIPLVTGSLPQKLTVHITTDNASNISKAVKDSGFVHVRCFAHTVNLAVQSGLSHVDQQLIKMRRVVSYLRRSTKATIALQV